MQGSLTNTVPVGYQMLCSQVPQADRIHQLGLVPPIGSKILKFVSSLGTVGDWNTYTKTKPFGAPFSRPNIAEGMLVWNKGAAFNWIRNFTVALLDA